MSPGEPRPYQTAGSAWIYTRLSSPDTRAVLLCDDPGLGKTQQALNAADKLHVRRMLVVAPAGARRVWAQEIGKWHHEWRSRVLNIEPGVKIADVQPQLGDAELIVLISYDALSQTAQMAQLWTTTLTKYQWDLLVVDEAHYLKGFSNRTRAVYGDKGTNQGIHTACDRVLLLTGTPTPNHAGELWHHIRTLWPDILIIPSHDSSRQMSEAEFQERFTEFTDTKWGRMVTRSKNQAVLRERLKPYVLHRSKRTVLPELPPVVTQDVPLSVSRETIRENLTFANERLHSSLSNNTRLLDDDAFIAALMHAQRHDLGNVASLRRCLGELKVDAAADWITERMECGVRKMLVFGWHQSVIDHLLRRLHPYDPVSITGQTTPNGRTNAIDLFQTRETVRVFAGQIIAAGTAITLTEAMEVTIVEPSWVPGENRQAIDRAHRIGQHNSVLANFLFVPGTLDERIMQVFRRKAADVAPIIPDKQFVTT